MRTIDLVQIGLKQGGFDGLYNADLCGCEVGDLAPCGEIQHECTAGYKHVHSKNAGGFVICPQKEKLSDEEIEALL